MLVALRLLVRPNFLFPIMPLVNYRLFELKLRRLSTFSYVSI